MKHFKKIVFLADFSATKVFLLKIIHFGPKKYIFINVKKKLALNRYVY